MTRNDALDQLRRHQAEALAMLGRGVECIERGPEAIQAEAPALRQAMMATLSSYQRFKHEQVFDPGIASHDAHRAALARAMKITCIAAGEVYRAHLSSWTPARIAADWSGYRTASRLTINQLRRQIVTEGEGVAELIEAYG